MNAIAAIFLDERRKKSNGTFPLKLRLTYLRRRRYYAIDMDMSLEDWHKIKNGNPRKELLKTKLIVNGVEIKANNAIQNLGIFSFERFEKAFFKRRSKLNVYDTFEDYIEKLKLEGRISTGNSYGNALASLKSFRAHLLFIDVTVEFLKSYEIYMIKNGKGYTTIGIYLRNLRTILNLAIEEGTLPKENYPFGKRKYKIPTGKNIKKALPICDVEKLYNYKPIEFSLEDKSKDFWFLSYYCNGANIKDILRLKYEDIQEDKLTFRRAKTENSQRDGKTVTVILNTEAKAIIKKWAFEKNLKKGYIFPFLEEGITPEREYTVKNQFIKNINKGIKKIGENIGLEKKITTYTARHTFSTVLKRSGAPVEFISESLGHADIKTTENYLDSFEDDMKRKYVDVLTQF